MKLLDRFLKRDGKVDVISSLHQKLESQPAVFATLSQERVVELPLPALPYEIYVVPADRALKTRAFRLEPSPSISDIQISVRFTDTNEAPK